MEMSQICAEMLMRIESVDYIRVKPGTFFKITAIVTAGK